MTEQKKEKHFYNEVDRSRYQAQWGCLVTVFLFGLVIIALGWWLAKRAGLL